MISSLSLLQVRLSKLAILLGDLLAFAAAAGFASTLLNVRQDPERVATWFALAILGIVLFLMRFEHYSDRRPFWDELGEILRTILILALLDMTLVTVSNWQSSQVWWMWAWPASLASIVFMRWLVKFILKKRGLWVRPTVIIGHGNNALDAQNALHSEPSFGFQVVGFVDVDCQEPRLKYESQVKLDYIGLQLLAKRPGVQWVIALEHSQSDQREEWLRKLASWGAQDINVIPAMRGVPLYGTNISHFFSHEVALLRVHNNLRRWPARLSKRIFDTLVALVLIVLLSPLLLLLSLLLLGDGGKVIFSQKRVGKNGRPFNCLKFRTMALDAEDQLKLLLAQSPEHKLQWEKDQKLKDDPRVSALGGFLRRTSLDELPQLFNVLQGQMSLVGPRPIVEAELQRYGSDASYYLMVRPGMTGLWQVNGRNDLDYESRVYLDTWYVKNWSLWYDLVILIKTIRTVLSSKGAY